VVTSSVSNLAPSLPVRYEHPEDEQSLDVAKV
jgi:hypothetical protein